MRSAFVLTILTLTIPHAFGESPRVRVENQRSKDGRLESPKTLNGHFPFKVPSDAGAWYERAELLRRRILVATGLWPMPEKTPLNAVIHGKSQRDGFSIEKVYFESLPGHFVTGLLFRPSGEMNKKIPGILCPHGHGGRMQAHSDAELASQIKQGAEHFEESGRNPKIARCVQLARMGCVSFIFDMLGYEDSIQISYEVAHRHQNSRPEELVSNNAEVPWVFYSPEADLRCQSIMGLQTWNAIRALDFLESLPDVDANRLAVTGGSGGGTQSILLGAIDDRVKVSFPNGMVSTSMQGGCYCENCNLLRIDTGNVELAALFAPRPQAMTAADDWTRAMMKDGYPELQWLYAMIGDEKDVYCRPMLHFKHNYNYVTRATMYQWMNQHLELGLDIPVIEQDFKRVTESEASVWNDDHPAPKQTGVLHEQSVCQWWDKQSNFILAQSYPKDQESFEAYKSLYGKAWEIIFDQGLPNTTVWEELGSNDTDLLSISRTLIRCPERGTEIPMLVVSNRERPEGYLVWTAAKGKDIAFDQQGAPTSRLSRLVNQNIRVLIPDLIHQGEWAGGQSKENGQRLVDDKRAYSAFSYGYNRSLAAERSSDLLTVIAAAKRKIQESGQALPLYLLGDKDTAAWAAPSAAIAGSVIDHAILQTDGFRFSSVTSFKDEQFVPGSVKYGDVPSLLALRAPYRTTIIGEREIPKLPVDSYRALDASAKLQTANQLNYQKIKTIDD